MQDATLTDVTCIELLIGELINENTFGRQIFSRLWSTYINCRADLGQVQSGMAPEERRKQMAAVKTRQRSSIHLLRMIGSNKIDVLLYEKANLYSTSTRLARA